LDFGGVYQDTISGKTFQRPELKKLYEYCQDNDEVDYIFVYKWDRFGRNVEEALKWVRLFHEIGVEVNCPFENARMSNPNDKFIIQLHFSLAELESERISERTKAGNNSVRRRGIYVGTAPFGYSKEERQLDKIRKILIPNDDSFYVKEAFKKVAEGDDRGSLYKSMESRISIKRSSFFKMFKNVVYMGKVNCPSYLSFPEELIDGKHEALIEEELFNKVQAIIARSPKTNTGKTWSYSTKDDMGWYLKPVLRCDMTGKKMTASKSTNRLGNKYAYYQPVKGKGVRISVKKAHIIVSEAIKKLSFSFGPEDLKYINFEIQRLRKPEKKVIEKLKRELSKTSKRIDKMRKDYMDGHLPVQDYNDFTKELNKKKNELKREIDLSQSKLRVLPSIDEEFLNRVYTLPEVFEASNPTQKQKLLKCLFPQHFSIDKDNEKVEAANLELVSITSYTS